jgi:hypothetical protein
MPFPKIFHMQQCKIAPLYTSHDHIPANLRLALHWQQRALFEALLLLPRIPIQSFGNTLNPVLATSVVG